MNAATVNAFQESNGVHPLTCGNCEEPRRSEKPLLAVDEADGVVLYCLLCLQYRQVMTDNLLEVVTNMYEALGNSRR